MKTFKDFMFAYYWTKGEKARKKGDNETSKKCKNKIRKFYK